MAYPAAPPIQLLPVTDFTGGLNYRADALEIADGESPDMLNVDLGRAGGFGRRDAVTEFNTVGCDIVPKNLWTYANGSGTYQVMIQNGGGFAYASYDSTEFTGMLPDALTCAGTMRAATMSNTCFIQRNAENVGFSWNGTTATVLGTTFNDNIASPNGGDIPKAKCIAAHGGYMWVANTVETGTAYKSRVRWSHPNQPGDWRTNDYIDVDIGHDGDEITALVPFRDSLLVFKRNSVHIINGYDPESFNVQLLTSRVGAISQEAVATSESTVYWYSMPDGVFSWSGGPVEWAFNRIAPKIYDGTITESQNSTIALGWVNRRLWVSVPEDQTVFAQVEPYTGQVANNRVYVLDPSLSRRSRYGNAASRLAAEGGWTKYDLKIGPMCELRVPGVTTMFLAASANKERVLKLHQGGLDADRYLTDAAAVGYTTPDSVALSITGDITVSARVALTDWTPASSQTLIAKWETTGNQRSWSLSVNSSGNLVFEWSNDGTTVLSATSTTTPTVTNGYPLYVRAALDVINGANKTVTFYTSPDGNNWSTLGAAVTTAGNTAVFNSTAKVTLFGRRDAFNEQLGQGSFFRASIASGLPGGSFTEVADPDVTKLTEGGSTSILDTYANLWTYQGVVALVYDDPNIASYYITRWMDLGQPAQQKRWKRPEIAVSGGDAVTFSVDVYRNYDASDPYRTLTFTTTTIDTDSESVKKLSSLGLGRSVRLKFTPDVGTTSPQWGIDSITYKFIPRRVTS